MYFFTFYMYFLKRRDTVKSEHIALSTHFQKLLSGLMVDVQTSYFRQEFASLFLVTQSEIAHTHHQVAVNLVAYVQVVVPNQQVGK